MAVLEGWSLG